MPTAEPAVGVDPLAEWLDDVAAMTQVGGVYVTEPHPHTVLVKLNPDSNHHALAWSDEHAAFHASQGRPFTQLPDIEGLGIEICHYRERPGLRQVI